MTHAEFVAAYGSGKLAVRVDPKAAARFVSSRMLLPLILLPLFGAAVGLALTGYLIGGIALFVAAFGFRYMVRRTAGKFVLLRSLEDSRFYENAVAAGVLSYSRDSS